MTGLSALTARMMGAKAAIWLAPKKPEPFRFFPGLHQPSDAWKITDAGPVQRGFISVHRLANRKSDMQIPDDWEWIMDSGAFSTILLHHGYPEAVEVYAAQIRRWSKNGCLLAAVAQDYMCERYMCAATLGLPVEMLPRGGRARELALRLMCPDRLWQSQILVHQRLTIERYDALTGCDVGGVYIMPVLQGYAPADYVAHIRQYGDRLKPGTWVGVGSVCKRNGDAGAVEDVLLAIKAERPDLLIHGFGLKITSLGSGIVRELLHTADSMSWSYAERMAGRSANDVRAAVRFAKRIERMPTQKSFIRELAA